MLLTGRAYGNRATLELSGDTLTWRAQRGEPPVAENIATTPHDVVGARVVTRRWSLAGLAAAAAGAMWMASESLVVGAAPVALGLGLVAWRQARPGRYLALDLGARDLVLQLDPASTRDAHALCERIARREAPSSPPTLP